MFDGEINCILADNNLEVKVNILKELVLIIIEELEKFKKQNKIKKKRT